MSFSLTFRPKGDILNYRSKTLKTEREDIMGIITAILGSMMVLWALPAQVIKNHKEKRCGVVLPLIFLPIALYTVRAVYASQRGAWGIVLPDVIGVLISLVCLAQWFKYRGKD